MLTAARKQLLLERLARDGTLVATELARDLGTSEDTIRRDLRELAADGRLQRVHGGALPASPAMPRQQIEAGGKALVAAAAAALVQPGHLVILDGGPTALQLARRLDPQAAITVVTHSPTIAVALADHPRADVLVIGGRLYKHSVVACGAMAVEAAQAVHADLCFLGVTGVHPRHGLTTGDAEEAAMKRALAARAAETYVLASSEKIGTVSPHRVLPWTSISAVITDAGADMRTVRALRRRHIRVHVAGRSRPARNEQAP
jgi:DeoR/GlpR family transcriptional regulator of sugar metabolism